MKKILALVLALMMVTVFCFSMTSCGETEEPGETKQVSESDAPESTDSTPDTPEKTKLTMGTNAAFPPYEYYEGENIVGIDAEIAGLIAEKLGMELVIENMEFSSVIPAVVTGGIDIGMAGMTVTETRLKDVNFSSSYATGVQVVIVKEGSDIKSLDDLEGKKIGVQVSTTGDIYASDEFGTDNVIKYNIGADAVLALNGGDVDAVIIDNEPAKAFVSKNQGLTILDTEYAVEEYAIAVSKENTELLEKINVALEELTESGDIDSIIGKYISAE